MSCNLKSIVYLQS